MMTRLSLPDSSKAVWDAVGGYDEHMGAGGEDRDIGIKTRLAGYKVGRITSFVMHNEGNLQLMQIFKNSLCTKEKYLNLLKRDH